MEFLKFDKVISCQKIILFYEDDDKADGARLQPCTTYRCIKHFKKLNLTKIYQNLLVLYAFLQLVRKHLSMSYFLNVLSA